MERTIAGINSGVPSSRWSSPPWSGLTASITAGDPSRSATFPRLVRVKMHYRNQAALAMVAGIH